MIEIDEPDYSTFSDADLEYAEHSINKEMYPERYQRILAEKAQRPSRTLHAVKPPKNLEIFIKYYYVFIAISIPLSGIENLKKLKELPASINLSVGTIIGIYISLLCVFLAITAVWFYLLRSQKRWAYILTLISMCFGFIEIISAGYYLFKSEYLMSATQFVTGLFYVYCFHLLRQPDVRGFFKNYPNPW